MSRKQAPTPNSAISAPAAAGPRMRAEWTTTEFSETALTTRSGPTISITKHWRAGLSSALTDAAHEHEREDHPRLDARRATVSANSASAGTPSADCVIVSRRRLGMRSASRPPQAPNSRIGRNCSAAVRPTATPVPVSCTISHISATICIQLPEIETTWPAK